MIKTAIDIAQQGVPNQQQQGKELPPKVQREVENYRAVLTKIMHGKENRDNVLGLLRSYQQPELAVPEVANVIMDQADTIMGTKAPNEYKLGLSGYVIGDLIELGNAAKIWPKVDENEAKNIYQDTVQDYIHKGLKDKTIDPIELQASTEPLMTPQQKEIGAAHAINNGVPPEVDPRAAINFDQQKKIEQVKQQETKAGGAVQ